MLYSLMLWDKLQLNKCLDYRSCDSLSTANLVGGGGGAPDQICGRLSSDKVTLAVGGEVALSNGTSVASLLRNQAFRPKKTNLLSHPVQEIWL